MDYSFQEGDTSECLTRSVPRVQLPRLREVILSFWYSSLSCLHSPVVLFLPHTSFLHDMSMLARTQAEVFAQAKPHT